MGNNNYAYIPSWLNTADLTKSRAQEELFQNSALHVGVVVASYEVDNTNNNSKYRREYDVNCYNSTGRGASIPITYYRCRLSNMFGGVADYMDYTLRADPITDDGNGNYISNGSTVLIICANGDAGSTYIIGASKNRNTPPEPSDEGHHLTWVFNGVEIKIKDDGSLSMQHTGPTDITGNITDPGNFTQALFKADGSIELSNNSGDAFMLEKLSVTLTSTEITLQAPSITLTNGLDFPDPILKANPAYVSAFTANQEALSAASGALIAFAAEIIAIGMLPPTPATALAKLLTPTAQAVLDTQTALIPTIETHTGTVVPGVAISTTVVST